MLSLQEPSPMASTVLDPDRTYLIKREMKELMKSNLIWAPLQKYGLMVKKKG
jgi:hypothetical protein